MTLPNPRAHHRSNDGGGSRGGSWLSKPRGILMLIAGVVVVGAMVLVVAAWRSGGAEESLADAPAEAQTPTMTLAEQKGETWYASPTGVKGAKGTKEQPMDLETALSSNSPAAPGDTVWLRGGVYKGNFVSELRGAEQAPILVRQFTGERAVIHSASAAAPALTVTGPFVWFADFEVMNPTPERFADKVGVEFENGHGIQVPAPHVKFINLIVHDLESGFMVAPGAEDVEIYGNLVYYNGWQRADNAGEGHGINTSNRTASRSIRDNIIFGQFGHGIYSFGSSDNLLIEGNTLFNNGGIAKFFDRNVLVDSPARNLMLRNNTTYYTGQADIGGIDIGYGKECTGARVIDNYLTSGFPLILRKCEPSAMRGNTIVGRFDASYKPKYGKNNVIEELMSGVKVFVRPNVYENERANITIYNWNRLPEVTVDLSPMKLKVGERFELRNAQDYFGPPVMAGTYEGTPLKVSLLGLSTALPLGKVTNEPPQTGRTFAAFVLVNPAVAAPAGAAATTTAPASTTQVTSR